MKLCVTTVALSSSTRDNTHTELNMCWDAVEVIRQFRRFCVWIYICVANVHQEHVKRAFHLILISHVHDLYSSSLQFILLLLLPMFLLRLFIDLSQLYCYVLQKFDSFDWDEVNEIRMDKKGRKKSIYTDIVIFITDAIEHNIIPNCANHQN